MALTVPPGVILALSDAPLNTVSIRGSYVCAKCKNIRYAEARCPAGEVGPSRRLFCGACCEHAAAVQQEVIDAEAASLRAQRSGARRMSRPAMAIAMAAGLQQRGMAPSESESTDAQQGCGPSEEDVALGRLSPLLKACWLGDVATARVLLDRAAYSKAVPIEDAVPDGPHRCRTPLILAAQSGSRELVELLLSRGALADAMDLQGMTALMHAAYRGNTAVVDELLFAGAAVNRIAFCGYSAVLFAANRGHVTTVKRLVAGGADLQARTPHDRNVLLVAAFNGHEDCVRALLEQPGVELDAIDAEGYDAFDAATVMNHRRVAALIQSRGLGPRCPN